MQALVPVTAMPYLSHPTSGIPFWVKKLTLPAHRRCTGELCMYPYLCLSVCCSFFCSQRLVVEFRLLGTPMDLAKSPHWQPPGCF